MCLGQSSCRLGRVDPYFSHELYIYIYKENNIYLPFGKLCNKLLEIMHYFEFTTYIKNELN